MSLQSLIQSRYWSIFMIWLFFATFFFANLYAIYLLLSFNIKGIIVLIVLLLIQKMVGKRNKTYIDFVSKYVRPWEFFRKNDLIYESQVDYENVIFACAPHSVYCISLLLNMNRDHRPLAKSIGLGSRFVLNSPIHGMLLKWWGVQSVDSKNMQKLMDQRKNIAIIPGGYEEATLTNPKIFRIFIKQRKGFIKMALKHGYQVCPVVNLGEHQIYRTVESFKSFRLFLNRFKIPAVIHYSKFGMFPEPQHDVCTIVGKPIQLPKISKPTSEEIDEWHSKYISQFKNLYEKYKHLNNNLPIEIY